MRPITATGHIRPSGLPGSTSVAQRFRLSVLAALRQTAAGSALVRELTAAPDLRGWVIVERLLKDLAPLDDQLWLVVDDMHELGPEALQQLELLLMRARRSCGSCWSPGTTCGWASTGCAWKAIWPRSASRICGQPRSPGPRAMVTARGNAGINHPARRPGGSCRGRCRAPWPSAPAARSR
jgi:hypothetical protein